MTTAIFNNNSRITFGSFLAYFVMSAIISPLGLISAPIAEHFDISLTAANASFTYLTSGVFVGTLIAVFIFDFIKLRQVVIGGVAIICLSIYSIYAFDSFFVFSLCLGLIGASCGVELSAAAVVIAKIYSEKLRASMLLLTDSFYSMAGVISTTLAGMLLARQFHWSSAYLLAFAVSLGIGIIALFSKYPLTSKTESVRSSDAGTWNWPASVHLVGVSMLIYLVGFVTIYSWVPNYAQAVLGLSVEGSSEVVSRMFLGMFVGQLIMFFLVLRFPIQALIVIYASMATLLTVSLWSVQSALHLEIAMLCLGLATGGLFKTVLSYGTTAVLEPSPKMVSYLIFHAGLGTAVAPFLSSFVVEKSDMTAALQFATVCYVLTFVLILAARRSRQSE
ncbi:MAG: MFS transporter TsgA [Woeseiaceae bacterium]